MKRLFIFRVGTERWTGESPFLPGCYLLGNSCEEVLKNLRAQICNRSDELKGAHVPVVEGESELLIVGL